MLPIYICENDNNLLTHLQELINDILLFEALDAKIVFANPFPSQLLAYLTVHETPSLYFLSLESEEAENGFMLTKNIRKHDPRGFIVFLSSCIEYLPLTLKYNTEAMDYIVTEDCPDMKKRLQNCIVHALDLYTLPSNKVQKVIGIRLDGRIRSVKLSEIYCIETSYEAHKIRIYDKNGYTELFYSLKEIRPLLDDSFFQCHKSCIVNLAYVQEVNQKNYTAILDNRKCCPVATRHMRSLISKIHI